MLQWYVKGKDRYLGLGFEGGAEEISRPIEVFDIFQKKIKAHVHLEEDEVMKQWRVVQRSESK